MGCCFAIRDSNSSAGGQLEQPSEVNSSTTTGVRVGPAAGDTDCGRGRITAITAKTDSRLSVNPAERDFMEISRTSKLSDTHSGKRFPALADEQCFAPHNQYVSFNWLLEAQPCLPRFLSSGYLAAGSALNSSTRLLPTRSFPGRDSSFYWRPPASSPRNAEPNFSHCLNRIPRQQKDCPWMPGACPPLFLRPWRPCIENIRSEGNGSSP